MENKDFENIIKNILKESHNQGKLNEDFGDDDEEDNLGMFSGEFDSDEFKGAAMDAARQDIGSEFEPLGQSKFEKNLDQDEFISDLQRQNLNLPNDKAERNRLKAAIDKKKKHEKMFGAGSMNEESETSIDEHHFDMKSIYNYFKDAFYSLSDMGPEAAAQILEATFKRDWPTLQKHLSEGTVQEDVANVEAPKVYRPKDSEGNDLKIDTIIKYIKTGQEGKILRFGVTENGKKLVARIEWFDKIVPIQGTPQSLPPKDVEPQELIIRKKEGEIEESMGHSHTVGKGTNLKPSNYPEDLKRTGLNESTDNKMLDLWWSTLHPFDKVEVSKKHFPEKHFGDITADDIMQMFQKDFPMDENLDSVQPQQGTTKTFLVVDDAFNRAHYADLIGQTFDNPPSYARVKQINPEDTEAESKIKYDLEEDYDFAGEERAYHDMKDHKEKQNLIGKEIVIKNMNSIQEMLFPNNRRIKSILDSIKDEIINHRVFNDIIAATDNMDTDWLFDIVNVTDNIVELEFTGTAK